MNLAARAADLRGNEFQHARAWRYAVDSLTDPDIVSVSVEDRDGGAFDDIVVRRVSAPNLYEQAKSSNYGNTIIDQEWLFTKRTEGGRSPLQHFFRTWQEVRERGESAQFNLVTNRGFDSTNRILGQARDQWDSRIVASRLEGGTKTANGRALKEWAEHLGIDRTVLLAFLADLRLVTTPDMTDIYRDIAQAQKNAGLRGDPQSVTFGVAVVRDWVMTGRRPVPRDEIASDVLAANLVDVTADVRLVVHGIDRLQGVPAAVELDFIDLYLGDSPQDRRELRDPGLWESEVLPRMRAVGTRVEGYGVNGLRIEGWMRLPMWFAIGRVFPRVRNWRLSTTQNGEDWILKSTGVVNPAVVTDDDGFGGTDLAVVIEISSGVELAVRQWIEAGSASIHRLLVLQPDQGPSQTAVPDAGWLMAWVDGARGEILARTGAAPHVHLFMSTPASAALALGHQWNLMPATTVYEWLPQSRSYVPTLTTS